LKVWYDFYIYKKENAQKGLKYYCRELLVD